MTPTQKLTARRDDLIESIAYGESLACWTLAAVLLVMLVYGIAQGVTVIGGAI